MCYFKKNVIILEKDIVYKNRFILSHTKNLYSFYKNISLYYLLNNKQYFFSKYLYNDVFFFFKKTFFIMDFLKQYFIYFNKNKTYSNTINNHLISKNQKTNDSYYKSNHIITLKFSKHMNTLFLLPHIFSKNKFFFFIYHSIFNDVNKHIKIFIKKSFDQDKNIFIINKKKTTFSKFYLNKQLNKKKLLFNFFLSTKKKWCFNFFLSKKKLKLKTYFFNINIRNLYIYKYIFYKKKFFFIKKKNHSHLIDYNYYNYIHFYNRIREKSFSFFKHIQKKIILTKSDHDLFYLNKTVIKYLLSIYNSFLLKPIKKNIFFKNNKYNYTNDKLNSFIVSHYYLSLRYNFKNIYLYYFFLSYKKKMKMHFLSNLYSSFFFVGKERFSLRKKLSFFFNINNIGVVFFKNTLRNIFITLSNYKGRHLYHISSGCLKFLGRKKVLNQTIYYLTLKFLLKIKVIFTRHKISYIKIKINGHFNDVFVFLRPFVKTYYFFNNIFYIFKKYIFFLKKYMIYIKYMISSLRKLTVLNLNKYMVLISYCYYLFSYLKRRVNNNDMYHLKITDISIKSKQYFSN